MSIARNLRTIAGGALVGVILADLLARLTTTGEPSVIDVFDYWGAAGGALAVLPLADWKRGSTLGREGSADG